MAIRTLQQLKQDLRALIRSGNSDTKAEDVRTMFTNVLDTVWDKLSPIKKLFVNGQLQTPDEEGNVNLVVNLDTSNLATKDELSGKADTIHGHTIGEVENLQLTLNNQNQRITKNEQDIATLQSNPGTTINSTDDIANEGAVNKWFTDARVYLAKAAGYVIQGTSRAITQSDSLMMILGIFENRLNLLNSGKQNTLTFDSTPTAGSSNPVTSAGIKTYVDATTANNRNFSIDVDQLRTTFRACYDVKVQYTSVKLLADVTGVQYQLVKNAVAGTVRTTLSAINADIAALTATEVNNGYAVNFYFVITAGKDAGGAIVKSNVI